MSDLHLEEPKDAEQVSALAALAAERAAAVLLIVGDFFDNARVSDETLKATAAALGQVPARVVILPGNHDPFMAGSPYTRADLGANVRVLSAPGGETHQIAGPRPGHLGPPALQLRRLPADGRRPAPRPGHVAGRAGPRSPGARPDDLHRAYLIDPAEIAASGRDYVALGHWDVPFDASSGAVVAAYSGSPSRMGACALTTLWLDAAGGRHVDVERLKVT